MRPESDFDVDVDMVIEACRMFDVGRVGLEPTTTRLCARLSGTSERSRKDEPSPYALGRKVPRPREVF